MEIDFKTLYHQAPCGYLYAQEDGILIEVNTTFLAFSGYQREEIIGQKRFEDFLTLGGKIYHETHFAPLLQMGGEASQINFDLVRKDGTRFPVLLNAIQQRDEAQQRCYTQFVVLDITQRKQYESELLNARRKSEELLTELSVVNEELSANMEVVEEQRQQLEKLNATKDKFFSIVAHDLRSPLTSLKSFASLLENNLDNISRADLKQMGKELHQTTNTALRMADNLIAWAMMQMNEVSCDPTKIPLRQVIDSVIAVFSWNLADKKIAIDVRVSEGLYVLADLEQIKFVIRNLINNAIKFTPPGGSLSVVSQAPEEDRVELWIADTGVGISPDNQAKLFAVSSKLSTIGTKGEKGTGLGLILAQEFMVLNGGSLRLVESGKGGTTFSIQLKKAH